MENSISVVVCSKDNGERKEKLINHIKETCGANVHTYFMYNPDGVGLSEIYNTMLSDEKNENSITVFIHDDIEFLKSGWGAEILRLFNEHEDYGIIGVAGSAEFDSNAAWWQYNKKYGQGSCGSSNCRKKPFPLFVFTDCSRPDGFKHLVRNIKMDTLYSFL